MNIKEKIDKLIMEAALLDLPKIEEIELEPEEAEEFGALIGVDGRFNWIDYKGVKVTRGNEI